MNIVRHLVVALCAVLFFAASGAHADTPRVNPPRNLVRRNTNAPASNGVLQRNNLPRKQVSFRNAQQQSTRNRASTYGRRTNTYGRVARTFFGTAVAGVTVATGVLFMSALPGVDAATQQTAEHFGMLTAGGGLISGAVSTVLGAISLRYSILRDRLRSRTDQPADPPAHD